MMLETVECGRCGATKIPLGSEACPYCGSTFKERWDDARTQNPAESTESLSLAMLDAEKIYAELSQLKDRTGGRSKFLRPKEMLVFVRSRCVGAARYQEFVASHVIEMWQSTQEAVAMGEKTFRQVMKPFKKRRFF